MAHVEARGLQHSHGRSRVLRLEGGVEAVGEQQRLRPAARRLPAIGRVEAVPPPGRQPAVPGEAGGAFAQRSERPGPLGGVEQRGERRQPGRVMRQGGHQPVAERQAAPGLVLVQELDLHPRHVHPGRAFAPAALAADAELHGAGHVVGGERIGPKLAGEREPQRVGAPARQVPLPPGRPEGGAHHAGVGLAAGAVVVAHLRRAEEAARPVGPVERRGERSRGVARPEAEERAVVHPGRANDLAGIEEAPGVEGVLHLLEGAHERRPEHALVELRTDDAVAMLAGMAALVFAHHGEGFLRNGAHGGRALGPLQVQHRAHMQEADRGVGVPGAGRAVLLEDARQPVGEIAQILQRHGAVLDEGDRLALGLHRHDDVEPRLAHAPDAGLERRIGGPDDGARVAQIAHRVVERIQPGAQRGPVPAGEFDQQQRVRSSLHDLMHGLAEHLDAAPELDDGAVHQLDRIGAERHQPGHGVHGVAEAREMAHAQHPVRRHGLEIDLDRGEEAERAFGAHQQMGHVVPGGLDAFEIVAANLPQHVGEAARDGVALALGDGAHPAHEVDIAGRAAAGAEIAGHIGEAVAAAVGQDRLDGVGVVDHVAVADRARAAGVVRRHAAERGPAGGGDIDREHEAVAAEPGIQPPEHDARLDPRPAPLGIDCENAVQMRGAVHHQRLADGLARLGSAAAARQHRHAFLARDRERRLDIGDRARPDHAYRLDLVDGGVGGIAPALERVEQHLALDLRAKPRRQPGIADPGAGLAFRHHRTRHGPPAVLHAVSSPPVPARPAACQLFQP